MIRHFKDIRYTVEATVNGHSVDFRVFRIEGFADSEENTPTFWREGSSHNGDQVDAIDEAEVFCDGYVKWDGCSNWNFGDCYHHGCEREHLVNIGLILAACWDMTKELLPTWCD